MAQIKLAKDKPSSDELIQLENECKSALAKLHSDDSEVKLPVFIEFAGSPKSGKSSIIGIIAHFLRRMGVTVARPAEGASLRTPEPLKDDWLAFNTWSGCYALQNILVDAFFDPPVDVVLLDRGLFDIAAWMEFLRKSEKRIAEDDQRVITEFFSLDLWRKRVNGVFVFTADHRTSMDRENDCKLTPKPGSMMNEEKLSALLNAYSSTMGQMKERYPAMFHVDTSYVNNLHPDFQVVAFMVGAKIVKLIDDLGTQELLVTPTPSFEGFKIESTIVRETLDAIIPRGKPQFMERMEAEKSDHFVQVVPYALIRNSDGRYLMAQRRADLKRKELRSRRTILAGGHAERRDFSPDKPASVYETCLRRELDEEFVGIRIESITPKGFLYDPHSPVGTHHLAYIHEVQIGGKMNIRRQALDKEFGREAVDWVDDQEIRDRVGDLDPWSQIVATKLFGAILPESGDLFPRTTD